MKYRDLKQWFLGRSKEESKVINPEKIEAILENTDPVHSKADISISQEEKFGFGLNHDKLDKFLREVPEEGSIILYEKFSSKRDSVHYIDIEILRESESNSSIKIEAYEPHPDGSQYLL